MVNGTAQAAVSSGVPWVSLVGGVLGGAATVAITHLLFQTPMLKVRARRNIDYNDRTGEILKNRGSVRVANARGRPVTVDVVALMQKGNLGQDPSWEARLPVTLVEGDVCELFFEDTAEIRSMRRIRPIVRDSLDRWWPRRRWLILWLWRWHRVHPVITWRIRHGAAPTPEDLKRLSSRVRSRHDKRHHS